MAALRGLFLILILFALSSCGYKSGYGALSGRYSSVSVPYVEGDPNGDLTAAIVHEVAASLTFEHRTANGELLLVVKLVDVYDVNIGFRYERTQDKNYKRSTIPSETRLSQIAEVSLVDANTGCTILPTVKISAWIDFDHEYNATQFDYNDRSLGQLCDADSAFTVARSPLNRLLARKIIEYISCSM